MGDGGWEAHSEYLIVGVVHLLSKLGREVLRGHIEHLLGYFHIFLVSYKQLSVPLDDQDLSARLVIPFLGIKSLKSLSSICSSYFIVMIDRLPLEGFLLWGLRILEAKVGEWKT